MGLYEDIINNKKKKNSLPSAKREFTLPTANKETNMSTFQDTVQERLNLLKENKKPRSEIDNQIGNLLSNMVQKPQIWDDGYQFGDVTKTVLGTGVDAVTGLVKGVANIGDTAGTLFTSGIAEVSDMLGNKSLVDKLRNRIAGNDEHTNKIREQITLPGILNNVQKTVNKGSILGDTMDNAIEGAGYYGGMLALQNVGVPWQVTSGVSSLGGGMQEAYQNGAKGQDAINSAALSAASEILSEYIFDGIKLPGTGKTTGAIVDGLTDKIKNKTLQQLAKNGVNILGEGAEEVLSGVGSALGKKLTYMNEKDLHEIYSSEEALNDFVIGSLTTAISNAPTMFKSKTNNNVDIPSSTQESIRNQIEKQVINQEQNAQNVIENNLFNKLEPYTQHEIDNYNGGKVKIANSTADIADFVERSKQLPSNAKLYFGKIGTDIANKIKTTLGISVENYNISLQSNAIRHILKNHGDSNIETARGQVAVTSDDFKLIPQIISEYDNVQKTGSTENNNPTITFQKQIGENYYLVSYVSDKKHTLEAKTMWKIDTSKKNSATASDDISPRIQTSETDSGTSSFLNDNNITNSTESQIGSLPSLNNMQQNESKIPSYKDFETRNAIEIPKDPTKESTYDSFKEEKKTRKGVQQELLQEMNITVDDLQVGNDISSIDMQRTDPIRLNEKVFGYKIGQKINDVTINKTKHNEAERTRFLNKERSEIAELDIKPYSKESAAVQMYGEKQFVNDRGETITYDDKMLANEFPNVETQNKIKNAANVIRGKYDTYIDQINSVITNMGYDAILKRKDYMRHFQEIGNKLSEWGLPLTNLNDAEIPTDINGLTDQFKPGKNWFANSMQRKGTKTTYDAITGIDGYLEGASNLIYHTEDIQRYRALSKMIRETYGQTHGLENINPENREQFEQRLEDIYNNKLSKYVAWLDEQANALAGKKGAIDRGFERALGRKVYTVLETAKKQVGSNMTGFNVRSALTNFASAVQGASKTNKLAFVKGTLSTVQNIIHKDNLIDKSDFLTSRFGSNQLSSKLWQKASNAGQILMSGSDYFTANQIWRSKYFENLSKGMSESQAIKQADDFSSRIMGDRSKGTTAEIFNSKTLGLFTQFQLEVNNQWSSLVHDNKMDVQRGNKSGAAVLFQLGQLAAMSYLFNNFMKSLTGSDVMIDPIDMLMKILGNDDEDKTLEERATEVFGDLIDDLPFASFLTGGRIPISEAFTGVNTLFKKATNQTDSYGNKIEWKDVKDDVIGSAFYWLLPTGYGQLKKTYKGAKMYVSKLPVAGSYTNSGNLRFNADETTGGKVKALLFGQYSSDESQKYIDSGYKAISKNRIQEMSDLKMSASEYRKYREGLTNAGKTNDKKMDYISNLKNATVERKNIMASNLLGKNIDIKEYQKYDSYDEYKYATTNPEKYSVISQITNYNKYNEYKKELEEIRNKTSNKKEATIQYINGLNLSIPQKAMFIKMYYSSFNNYNSQIIDYINSQQMTISEKTSIFQKLGFTVRDGRVYP